MYHPTLRHPERALDTRRRRRRRNMSSQPIAFLTPPRTHTSTHALDTLPHIGTHTHIHTYTLEWSNVVVIACGGSKRRWWVGVGNTINFPLQLHPPSLSSQEALFLCTVLPLVFPSMYVRRTHTLHISFSLLVSLYLLCLAKSLKSRLPKIS